MIIFKSKVHVKAVLLYASESWTITERMTERLQINVCEGFLIIHWPDRIAIKELWGKTGQEPVRDKIMKEMELYCTCSNRRRGSSATAFCLGFIADRWPHSTVYRR